MDWNSSFSKTRPRLPEGYTWVNGRHTRVQNSTRPDTIWSEKWHRIAAWDEGKTRLQEARRKRGIEERFQLYRRTGTDLWSDGLKCLCSARTGRLDLLWTVNMLARSVTKWNKACGKILARFDKLHRPNTRKQNCFV